MILLVDPDSKREREIDIKNAVMFDERITSFTDDLNNGISQKHRLSIYVVPINNDPVPKQANRFEIVTENSRKLLYNYHLAYVSKQGTWVLCPLDEH